MASMHLHWEMEIRDLWDESEENEKTSTEVHGQKVSPGELQLDAKPDNVTMSCV